MTSAEQTPEEKAKTVSTKRVLARVYCEPELWRAARSAAVMQGVPVQELVARILREYLRQRREGNEAWEL